MLSRICRPKGLAAIVFARQFKAPIAFASTYKTRVSQSENTSGQRDLVNFPRLVRLEKTPPQVMGFLPKSWFDFFHSKTGITGGYTLLFGLSVYMFSKEIIVVNSEFITALALVTVCMIIQKYLPIKEYLEKNLEEMVKSVDSSQEFAKQDIKNTVESLQKSKSDAEVIVSMLPDAKRENVYLQIEAAYRGYLNQAHSAVLNILNYNVEKSYIERIFNQKHLTNWLIRNVEASVTPEVKKVALEKAISDLKTIATSTGG